MLKFAATLIAFAVTVPAAAHDAPERKFNRTLNAAMKAEGPIVTDADKAQMRAKCGVAADVEFGSTTFTDGGLRCPDGRMVRDAETQAMSARISKRARHVADAALARADVALAQAELARAKAAEALRRVHARRH